MFFLEHSAYVTIKNNQRLTDWKCDFAESVVFDVAVPRVEELTSTPRDDSLQLNTSILRDKHTH